MTQPASSWSTLPYDPDDALFDPDAGAAYAQAATLHDFLDILSSPDGDGALSASGPSLTTTSGVVYPLHGDAPVLLPRPALRRFVGDRRDVAPNLADAFEQYLYLAEVKNAGGDHNTPLTDPWYRRHLHRSQRLLRGSEGLILDIGCDDPALSRRLFPPSATYLGLEPILRPGPMRVVGMAEFLPFADGVLDGVAFLTSLDHVLDYHAALDEAFRVLKPGGALYLGTLIWTQRAELMRDNIHFHHFREFEIRGALQPFTLETVTRYGWKGDTHRYGVYLRARKPLTTP